jgi:hypothetical protein
MSSDQTNLQEVLEAIVQYGCFHKLDKLVEASVSTCEDIGLVLTDETFQRFSIFSLKQKILFFTYSSSDLILDIIDSFKNLVRARNLYLIFS